MSRVAEVGVTVPDAEAIAPEFRFQLEADPELSIFSHEPLEVELDKMPGLVEIKLRQQDQK